MKKPTALIYGYDGFDSDVAINLVDFYSDLGFKVFLSRKLIESDLICAMRPPNTQIFDTKFKKIHIFDYACKLKSDFVQEAAKRENVTIFLPSNKALRDKLPDNSGYRDNVKIMLPPVSVKRWLKKIELKKWSLVHIGNFKANYVDELDTEGCSFLEFILKNNVEVWGEGWSRYLPSQLVHGRVALLRSSQIYCKAAVSVGNMYPYQRGKTISGRFWQSPLANCPILTERELDEMKIPGVFKVDFKTLDLSIIEKTYSELDSVSQLSEEFWIDHYQKCLESVRELTLPIFRDFSSHRTRSNLVSRAKIDTWNVFRNIKYRLRLDGKYQL